MSKGKKTAPKAKPAPASVEKKPKNSEKTSGSPSWLPTAILMLTAFVLYFSTLRYDYVLDDQIVYTENQFVQKGIAGIGEILSTESMTGYFGSQKDLVAGARYRPLSLVSFALEKSFLGQSARMSHFLNVLLYALLGFLLYRLLKRIFPPDAQQPWYLSLAFLASFLYLLHPIHTEAVTNVKGRDEILAALGAFGALYASWRAVQEGKMAWNLGAALLFFLGLLAKENTLTFLAVIPLTLWLFGKKEFRSIGINLGILLAVALAYIALRVSVVGYLLNTELSEVSVMNDPFLGLSGGQKFATIFLTLGWYLKLLVFPHPLTHDYYPYHVPVVGWGDWRALLGLGLHVAMIGVAIWAWKRKPIWTYVVLFYLCTMSITSNLPFTVGAFMNERFAFIPSLAFCLGLAWMLNKWVQNASTRTLAWGLLGVFALGFTLKTWARNPDWATEQSLNDAAYRISSNSARANLFQGVAKFNAQFGAVPDAAGKLKVIAEVMPLIDQSIAIVPSYKAALDFKAGLAGERYKLNNDLKQFLTSVEVVGINAPDGKNLNAFLNYLSVNNPVFLDFCYKVGYEELFKKKKDAKNAAVILGYAAKVAPGDARIRAALGEVQQK
jgi:hypothetical protein